MSGDLTAEGQEGASQGDGNVPYLDYSGGYTIVHICQNSSNCTLKMCGFYCI